MNVGGGGLLGGCASLVRAVAPRVRIVGAQSENTAAMSRSLAAGRVVEIENLPTLADGLAGQIDDEAFDIGQHALDEIVTLSEDEIARIDRVAVDASTGNASKARARARVAPCGCGRSTRITTPAAIVVSGGNIDPAKFEKIADVNA